MDGLEFAQCELICLGHLATPKFEFFFGEVSRKFYKVS